jgi:hypothetical protein
MDCHWSDDQMGHFSGAEAAENKAYLQKVAYFR